MKQKNQAPETAPIGAAKPARVVLTGGPCAGKTTLTQVILQAFQHSVVVVPESASLLFSAGFPRWESKEARRATQRAIYYVQRELEAAYAAQYPDKVLILDRGTVDGAAYWPEGPADFFASLGTSLSQELARYDRVIYLESAAEAAYLAHKSQNPNRKESWEEAKKLDEETRKLWEKHASMTFIHNQRAFGAKVSEVLAAISALTPVLDSHEQR